MGQKIILILLILAAGTLIYKCRFEQHTMEYPNPEEYPLDSAAYSLSEGAFEGCYTKMRDKGFDSGPVEDFCLCFTEETVNLFFKKYGREALLQGSDEFEKTRANKNVEADILRAYIPAVRKCRDRL